jgi:cell division protease FtsH
VVLAATNRPTALDEALTRPGRFDRVITIPYPNLEGRLDILKVHARDKYLHEDVNMNRVARATAGFSGAELMNLMNQSAIEAVRQVC